MVVVVAGIIIGLLSTGGSPPPQVQKPPPPRVPPVQPVASDFAEHLITYAGGGDTAYQKYEATLSDDLVGRNTALLAKLAGLSQAPAGSFTSQGKVTSTTVVQSGKSQAEAYVFASQTIAAPYSYKKPIACKPLLYLAERCSEKAYAASTTSRLLLIELTMARSGQRWLVSNAVIQVVSSPSGVLVPSGG